MNGLDLDDLPRRLADLADAAGPWDDPMPEVRRRIAAQGVTADADPEPASSRPAALRAKSRWRWPVDPFAIAAVAAVVLFVVALGWLIHSTGGDGSTKSASDAGATQASGGSSAAAEAATTSSASADGGSARRRPPAPATPPATSRVTAFECGLPGASRALSMTAPTSVRTGAVLSVRVRLTSLVAGSAQTREILAVADGRVVGRLVSTGRVGPGTAPNAVEEVVTGTLRASNCVDAIPKPRASSPKTLPGTPLTPGRYQLVVAVASARGVTVSAPVTVTVTH